MNLEEFCSLDTGKESLIVDLFGTEEISCQKIQELEEVLSILSIKLKESKTKGDTSFYRRFWSDFRKEINRFLHLLPEDISQVILYCHGNEIISNQRYLQKDTNRPHRTYKMPTPWLFSA